MHWKTLLQALLETSQPAMLVCVSRIKGSVPREVGAAMMVSHDNLLGTIGGGHLEYKAIAIARQQLASASWDGELHSFTLGAGLGQCCGGKVELCFQPVQPHSAWVSHLLEQLKNHKNAVLHLPISPSKQGSTKIEIAILSDNFHLILFGAGHVGKALVRVLERLPCTITWVDEREEIWEPDEMYSDKVTCICSDTPEAEVEAAPPHSYFLVMTHSHALDQRVCEQILCRTDFSYFGMIGSRSKRLSFEKRMQQRGVSAQQLPQMHCPIGLRTIVGKAPEIVALSVAAELMQIHSKSRNNLMASDN